MTLGAKNNPVHVETIETTGKESFRLTFSTFMKGIFGDAYPIIEGRYPIEAAADTIFKARSKTKGKSKKPVFKMSFGRNVGGEDIQSPGALTPEELTTLLKAIRTNTTKSEQLWHGERTEEPLGNNIIMRSRILETSIQTGITLGFELQASNNTSTETVQTGTQSDLTTTLTSKHHS